MVVGYHLGDKMTVIVDNGHLSRMIVEQILRHLGVEQEILVIELFHCFTLKYLMSYYIFDLLLQKYEKNSVFSNFLLNFARKKNVNDDVSE